MKLLPDFTGRIFGLLFVKRFFGIDKRKNRCYECECKCGNIKIVPAALLNSGDVRSCGCLLTQARNRNLSKACLAQTKHGHSAKKGYSRWSTMMDRCYNFKSPRFPGWGGRGIVMCFQLREGPEGLIKSIGEAPNHRYTVDRINNDGNYSCGDCSECLEKKWTKNIRWATAKEQSCNRRNNVWVSINGVSKTRSQWAEEWGIPYHKARYLLKPFEMKTYIDLPKGATLPDGVQSGEEFDMVCTFRAESDGRVCLTKFGETSMSEDDSEDSQSKPDYSNYAQGMQQAQQGDS